MYFLFGAAARDHVKLAHCALDDVRMCKQIFHSCACELARLGVCVDTMEDIWKASEIARVPTVMAFGKHKGCKIEDVPRDYARWLLGQPDVDPYLRQALQTV
jgi:exodeoxyribonuclease X